MFTSSRRSICARDDRQLVRAAVRARFRDVIVQAVSDKHLHLCNRLLLNVVGKLESTSGLVVCTVSDIGASVRVVQSLPCKDALTLVISCCQQAFLAGSPSLRNISTIVDTLACRICPTAAGLTDALASALRTGVSLTSSLPHRGRGVKRASVEMMGQTTLATTQRVVGDLYVRVLQSYARHALPAAKPDELPPARPRLPRRDTNTPPLSAAASSYVADLAGDDELHELLSLRKRNRVAVFPPLPSPGSGIAERSAVSEPSAVSMDDSTAALPPPPPVAAPPLLSSSSGSDSDSDDFVEMHHHVAAAFFGSQYDEEIQSDVDDDGEKEEGEDEEEEDADAPAPAKRRKS
jgi:hypothetical protein